MNRRELLKMIAAATGASLIGADAMAYVELPDATPLEKTSFSKKDYLLWEAICDTIIPRTDTPGAVDAGTPAFTLRFIHDCYRADQLSLFKRGLVDIEQQSQRQYGMAFTKLAEQQRYQMLSALNDMANATNSYKTAEKGLWQVVEEKGLPPYFTMMKQVTLFGFFTSEVGATQVLRYVSIPGSYDGNYPYNKGDKVWAPEY